MTVYNSDAAALEAAGKKQVLKVCDADTSRFYGNLANLRISTEGMELLGSAWNVGMHTLHMGGYERLIRGRIP